MEPQAQTEDSESQHQPDTPPENDIGGYAPEDIVKTPLEPPKPVNIEPTDITSNHKVQFLIGMAFALFLLGILLTLAIGATLGLLVMLLAAMAAVVAVFAPVK